MVPSSGILRLKRKTGKINDECLVLALNSILTKEQANRDVGGSVILHWRPKQIAAVAIAILPQEAQTKIQKCVAESFALRQESKRVLHSAKRAVEMAIEEDEETAVEWLNNRNYAESQPGHIRSEHLAAGGQP